MKSSCDISDNMTLKSQWAGYVARIKESRSMFRVLTGKPNEVSALDIFEALIFKYKLKSGLLDHIAVHFLPIISEFINQLQTLSRTFYEHNSLEGELLKNYASKELAFDALTLDNENGSNKESHDGNLSVPPLSKVFKKCEGSEVSHYKHTKRKETTKRCLKKNCVAAVRFGGSCICPSSQDKDKKERRNSKTEKETQSDVKLDANNSQTGRSIKSFTCEWCKRVFPSSTKLSAHMSKCCEDTQPSKLPEVFLCNECNFAFFSQNNLWVHKEQDCNYLELIGRQLITSAEQLKALKKYKCGVCQEEYRSHSRMLYHLSRCRRGPYKCELCQEQFDIKKALNLHKKKSHRQDA
uniref:C2H2-type domain-containing protein n=1 Tax=Timema genevievae TaxID=629358 RepID=A0A7R9JT54_TIMGE|nr:unnamed protein product [Timema genevievae]